MEVLFLEKAAEHNTINGVTLRSMLDLPSDFPGYQWTDDPAFKVIVTLTRTTERTFFRRLYKQLTRLEGFFSIGRPQIFAFVTGFHYNLLMPDKDIHGLSSFNYISGRAFFDTKCLGKFDWSNFHPDIKLPKKVSQSFYLVFAKCMLLSIEQTRY